MDDRDMVTDEELRRMIDDAARQVEEIMEGVRSGQIHKGRGEIYPGRKMGRLKTGSVNAQKIKCALYDSRIKRSSYGNSVHFVTHFSN